MANVIITLRIMPDSPDADLKRLESESRRLINEFSGETEMRVNVEPVAFGLKSVNITFVTDEKRGSTDELERQISELDGISSVEVTDVRRAVG